MRIWAAIPQIPQICTQISAPHAGKPREGRGIGVAQVCHVLAAKYPDQKNPH